MLKPNVELGCRLPAPAQNARCPHQFCYVTDSAAVELCRFAGFLLLGHTEPFLRSLRLCLCFGQFAPRPLCRIVLFRHVYCSLLL